MGNKIVLQLWTAYLTALNRRPLITKAITSCVISGAGNIVAQRVIEQNPKIDRTRLKKFSSYGFLVGMIIHNWFEFLNFLFKDFKGSKGSEIVQKLALDQLLFSPLLNTFFYTYMAFLEGKLSSLPDILRQRLLTTQLAGWRIWPAFQLINFYFVPPHLRVLCSNLVAFFLEHSFDYHV
eukprot:TRINITY_DN7372_c0_g1_i1.p1 TRINITY_DN7372_c0_g1~~TRINITY_DN7372_c0_g1_i1.p1  ORF type:complete len:197 (+),score=56.39 TRINITY_DN7372_c0_g1_i1:56-592(+)